MNEAMPEWNDWEIFDPRDGVPRFFSDTEENARLIADDYGLDICPRGMECVGKNPDGTYRYASWPPPERQEMAS